MRRLISAILVAAVLFGPAYGQDRTVDVTGLMVSSREQPAPRIGLGAPMYSPEQTASFVGAFQTGADGSVNRAQRAHEATVKAREVRMNPAATRSQMNEAERERQEAVREMNGTNGLLVGSMSSLVALMSRGEDDPTTERDGVEVTDVKTSRILENGRAVLNISGRAHNTGMERVELMPLAVAAVDANGFQLASQSSVLGKAALEPGEAYDFTVRFRKPPQYTATVDIRFSRVFQSRNFRGCDFFDPLIFNPRQIEVAKARAEATPVPLPEMGSGAPAYTAKELAILFPLLLNEAQVALNVSRTARRCPNDPPANLHSWRALFAQSDMVYEAWVATNAAEEVRRDAALGPVPAGELEAAELQRQVAVNAFVAGRPPPLRALSPDESPVRLEDVEISRTPEGAAAMIGQFHNTAQRSLPVHGLLVTVRDRHGLVVRETLRSPAPPLAPGEVRPFNFPLGIRGSVIDKVELAFRADAPLPPLTKKDENKDPCAAIPTPARRGPVLRP